MLYHSTVLKYRTAFGNDAAEAPRARARSLICNRTGADARNRTMKGRMNQMNFVTPSGFRDVLTDEAVLREQAAQAAVSYTHLTLPTTSRV